MNWGAICFIKRITGITRNAKKKVLFNFPKNPSNPSALPVYTAGRHKSHVEHVAMLKYWSVGGSKMPKKRKSSQNSIVKV